MTQASHHKGFTFTEIKTSLVLHCDRYRSIKARNKYTQNRGISPLVNYSARAQRDGSSSGCPLVKTLGRRSGGVGGVKQGDRTTEIVPNCDPR